MGKTRSELREKIMVILYQIDIYNERYIPYEVDEVISDNIEIDNEFVKNIVYGVVTYKDELDTLANSLMKDWTIDRIDKSGAAILRMALGQIGVLNKQS